MILAADQRSRFWATVTGVLGEKQNRKFGKEAKKLFGGWDLKKGTKKKRRLRHAGAFNNRPFLCRLPKKKDARPSRAHTCKTIGLTIERQCRH